MSEPSLSTTPVRPFRMQDDTVVQRYIMQHDGVSFSLLSLSIVAANAEPIDVPQDPSFDNDDYHSWRVGSVEGAPPLRSPAQGVAVHNGTKHRRLSSTGQARRRLSDARDAASRPS